MRPFFSQSQLAGYTLAVAPVPSMRCYFCVLFALAVGSPAYGQPVDEQTEQLGHQLERLTEVLAAIEKRAADRVDIPEAIYRGALPGMLRTLDPHTAFLDKDQYESLRQMQTSTSKGFGSILNLLPGRVTVLQTLPGSPSARSGLTPGDDLLAINGYDLSVLSVDQMIGLFTQARRTEAELVVRRPGERRLVPMTLVPADLADPSVERAFRLASGFGYIKVGNFEGRTAEELQGAIESLGGDDLPGLVLDLRDNPGGVVEAAIRAAALFLEPGQRLLYIEGRDGDRQDVVVPDGYRSYDFPMTILVSDETASAAELVAGALQDHGRAHVIGGSTYGKGLVQSVFDLPEGGALALTVARYLTPSGRSIQRPLGTCGEIQLTPCTDPNDPAGGKKGGIEPDQYVFPDVPSQLSQFLEANNAFLDFANMYLRQNQPEVDASYRASNKMLDEFQFHLSKAGIRPPLSDWTASVPYIESRLTEEVLNLKFGVAKGDEVAARRDAMIRAAEYKLKAL